MEDVLQVSYVRATDKDVSMLLVFKIVNGSQYVVGEFQGKDADSIYNKLTEQGNPFLENSLSRE